MIRKDSDLLKTCDKPNYVLTASVIGFFLFLLGSLGIRARATNVLMMLMFVFSLTFLGDWRYIVVDSYKKWWCLATLAQIVIFILPNARHPENLTKTLLHVILLTVFLLFIETNWYEVNNVFKLTKTISLFVASYVIFFRIFPQLYIKWIIPHLDAQTAEKVTENMMFGYGAALGNSYTYGDYLIMMGLAVFLGEKFAYKNDNFQSKRKHTSLYIFICMLGILMEGRKGELLSAILTVCTLYFVESNFTVFKLNVKTIFWVLIVMFFLYFVVSYLNDLGFLYRFNVMFDRLNGGRGDYSTGRIDRWKKSLEIFYENPLWGIGWGGYTHYSSGSYIAYLDKNAYSSVHNSLLQLLCESGLLGTSLILIPYSILFGKTLKHIKRLKNRESFSQEQVICSIFSFTLQLFFFLASFLDPVFYNHYFWFPYMIAIAVESYATRKEYGLTT